MNKVSQFKKRILIFGIVALFLIALPVTIYLVRTQQNLQQKASEAPTISLSPSSDNPLSVAPGDKGTFTILIDPKSHSVKHLTLVINYPGDKLQAVKADFKKDANFGLDVNSKTVSNNKITIDMGTSTANKYVTTPTTVGTIDFKAVGEEGDTATVTIDSSTVVKGPNQSGTIITFTDFQFVSGTVSIGAAICVPNQSTCKWDAVDGADTYHVTVTEKGNDTPIIDDESTSETSITFPSQDNKTYTCEVYATNTCGNTSGKDSDTQTCTVATGTPTSTPTVTTTPTNTPTPTPTETVTETPTPTEAIETETPTPTLPTEITATPTPVEITVATSTPIPTLPATGANAVTFGAAIAGALIVIGGLLLLIL